MAGACASGTFLASSFHHLPLAIAQQIAHFFDLGAADMKLETEEVGPLGEAGEMVYERGHEAITHEDGHLVFNGK